MNPSLPSGLPPAAADNNYPHMEGEDGRRFANLRARSSASKHQLATFTRTHLTLLKALYEGARGTPEEESRLSWLWEAIQTFLDDKAALMVRKEEEGNTQRLLSNLVMLCGTHSGITLPATNTTSTTSGRSGDAAPVDCDGGGVTTRTVRRSGSKAAPLNTIPRAHTMADPNRETDQVIHRMVLSLVHEERQAQAALCAPHEALLLAVQEEIQRLAPGATPTSGPPPVSPSLRGGPDTRLPAAAAAAAVPSSSHLVDSHSRISLSPSPWRTDPGPLEATLAHLDSNSVGLTKVALLQRLQHLILHLCPTLGPGHQL